MCAAFTPRIADVRQRFLVVYGHSCVACFVALAACPFVFSAPEINRTSDHPGQLIRIRDPLAGENFCYPTVPHRLPDPGESIEDSRLGTVQTRVTEKPGVRHEYARMSPFNANCSMILLLDVRDGTWNVYRTKSRPYDSDANYVCTLHAEEPRWDGIGTLWATRDFKVLQIDAISGNEVVVKDFSDDPRIAPLLKAEPDLYRITMKDEGEASTDYRFWAFIVQGANDDYRARYLLVWDRLNDQITGLRPLAVEESRIDWIGMSPLGTWVLIGSDHDNGGSFPGFVMADKTLMNIYPLHYSTGHADVGLDSINREVVVMQNAQTDFIDLIPLDPDTRPIPPGGDYAGTGHVPLVRLFYASDSPAGLQSGVHISCNVAGWCVVSTHMEAGQKEQNWLDRSIILVRLQEKSPSAYYVSKVHGSCNTYWQETHASISADGSRVVWASNWGSNEDVAHVTLMELALPPGWMKTLMK
ncbi:MAG: hypothetical protein AMXMBFR84_32410 [Candidatus Hydrogenedentota bacterium]